MSFGVNKLFKSKKAFKEAVEAGHRLWLTDTSIFADNSIRVQDIAEGQKVGPVVGPDVYRDRRWYATVTRKNGVLKVT